MATKFQSLPAPSKPEPKTFVFTKSEIEDMYQFRGQYAYRLGGILSISGYGLCEIISIEEGQSVWGDDTIIILREMYPQWGYTAGTAAANR